MSRRSAADCSSGEVGRGTFVRPSALDIEGPENGVLDLAVNALMPLAVYGRARRSSGRGHSAVGRRARVFGYQHHAGARHNRAAGSAWIGWAGVEAPVDRVVVTAGGQHAILLSLMALAKPGDEILVEEFTYPGITDLASHLHLRLRTVALDRGGHRARLARSRRAVRASRPRSTACRRSRTRRRR